MLVFMSPLPSWNDPRAVSESRANVLKKKKVQIFKNTVYIFLLVVELDGT